MGLRAAGSQLLAAALAAMAAALMAACATTVQQEIAAEPPTSVETLSYFPFQVKGYQNSYPRRRILVLMPVDARDFKDTAGQSHEPADGNPATGVMLGPDGAVVQRVYSSPLGPIVQSAIVRAADEAGMLATASNDTLGGRAQGDQRGLRPGEQYHPMLGEQAYRDGCQRLALRGPGLVHHRRRLPWTSPSTSLRSTWPSGRARARRPTTIRRPTMAVGWATTFRSTTGRARSCRWR